MKRERVASLLKQATSAAMWSWCLLSKVQTCLKRRCQLCVHAFPPLFLAYTRRCITQSAGLLFIEETWWQMQWSDSSLLFCSLTLTKQRNLSDCYRAQISSRVSKHAWVENMEDLAHLHVYKPKYVITTSTKCILLIQQNHVGIRFFTCNNSHAMTNKCYYCTAFLPSFTRSY